MCDIEDLQLKKKYEVSENTVCTLQVWRFGTQKHWRNTQHLTISPSELYLVNLLDTNTCIKLDAYKGFNLTGEAQNYVDYAMSYQLSTN